MLRSMLSSRAMFVGIHARRVVAKQSRCLATLTYAPTSMSDSRHNLLQPSAGASLNQASRSKSGTTSELSQAAWKVLKTRKSVNVMDSDMSYLDTEVGDNVVLFLHGNPTSAYLWRNVIPHVQGVARCLAPDLIGMGHSGKPDIGYKFRDHYRYLTAWIDEMKLPKKLSIVCHDWGSALGFHWAFQNKNRVKSIVHMESVVSPVPNWDRFPEEGRKMFQALRSNTGEEIVLKKNLFVERLLPGSILRTLSEEEMEEYRAPYGDEKSRLPTLVWPREIPIKSDGPADVVKMVDAYKQWLSTSKDIPKLYIHGDPGYFSPGIQQAIKDWPNQQTTTVRGLHFLQEDSPDDIGVAIRDFLKRAVYV